MGDSQLQEIFRKNDTHKSLISFAFKAHSKLPLKGIAKVLRSISDPIERGLAVKWLEIYGCIFHSEWRTQGGNFYSTYDYKPTPEFKFDLENAWINPYYSQSNFHLTYPFFFDTNLQDVSNIFSPLWFVQPDEVKEKLIQAVNVNSFNDTAINRALENAINAFWRSHKHDAGTRSTQENAQLLFKLIQKGDSTLAKKVHDITDSMVQNYLNAETTHQKAKASLSREQIKPSDMKPEGAEECYVCVGSGKTQIGRVCSRCMGRGFILKKI